jgi:hypothetical protein
MKMKMNFKYDNIDNQDLHPKKQKMLKQLGLPMQIRVPIRMRGLSSKGIKSLCHHNTIKMVKKHGGKRLVGHTIASRSRGLEVFDHSVWITPENNVACITKSNHTREEIEKGYIVFLPRMIDESPDVLEKNVHHDFLVSRNHVAFIEDNSGRVSHTEKLKHAGKFMEKTYKVNYATHMHHCTFLDIA